MRFTIMLLKEEVSFEVSLKGIERLQGEKKYG